MAAPITVAVFGSTGLTGSHILNILLGSESVGAVHTISRRAVKVEEGANSSKLHATVEAATEQWVAKLAGLQPPPSVVYSALGTTRAAAGGIANQWKIDHDLNVELARAAKEAGVGTYVFVSSAGTRGPISPPYAKMKVGVEDTIKGLGFDQAIILRPGGLIGQRDQPRTMEGLAISIIKALGKVSQGLVDAFAQDGLVVGRAAVAASLLASQGKAPSKYWVLEQADIVRLGRTEWKA